MKKHWLIPIALLLCVVCYGQHTTDRKEFSLPAIPSELRTPTDRANYLVMHYWDKLDFTDTLYTRDTGFMEQTFVNYLSIFPIASPDTLASSITTLVKKAEADSLSHTTFAEWAEKYLYDPYSPQLNEESYRHFLSAFLQSSLIDTGSKMRYRRQWDDCNKNRPGTIASNFTYQTIDGKRCTLHHTPAEQLLLIFYDPECDTCHEAVELLEATPLLAERIKSGRLSVLAIYTEGDKEAWKNGKNAIPSHWTNGYESRGEIRQKETYLLRTLPTLYLLDARKRVILKDTTPQALINYMEAHNSTR